MTEQQTHPQEMKPRIRTELVVLMDCSAAMQPRFRAAKALAAMMPHEIRELFRQSGRNPAFFRARVVPVRAGTDAWPACQSFSLLNEEGTAAYIQCLNELEASGEADVMQTLDVLKEAMQQEYAVARTGEKARHIILLITSAAAAEDPDGALEAKLQALADAWDGMDSRGKRLFMITPPETPWGTVKDWENTAWSDVLFDDQPLTRARIWESVYFMLHPGYGAY